VEEVLERAQRVAQQAEVFYLEAQETPVGFENNRLKHLQTSQTEGLALRIIVKDRIGFAATTDLRDPSTLVETALEVAHFGPEARFDLPTSNGLAQVETYDPLVEGVSLEQMIGLGEALIEKVRSFSPHLVCQAGVSKQTFHIRILNSRGGNVSYRKSLFRLGIEGVLVRDTDMLFVGEGETHCRPIEDYATLADRILRQLELARDLASVSTKEMPVLFSPHGVQSALVLPLLTAFNGKTVLQGASPLGNRQGERVFDPQLSLVDDATLPFRPASAPYDDEGTPTRPITLIRDGVVGEFLYDLQTAGLAGTQSTGSARRALESLPSPSASALLFPQGQVPVEEIIADMQEGLVVEYLMGASQGNLLAGEFSGNILLGYKVERGRLVGRVKDAMVSGNVYEALKEGIVLGNDARWVGGSLYTPSIYIPQLSVSARG
jgi:PmbA protein